MSVNLLSGDEGPSTVYVMYSDRGGIQRALRMRMPHEHADAWVTGLRTLLKMFPPVATPAHTRWSMSCMAATSKRGATGFIRRTELRSLLVRANASARLTVTELDRALTAAQEEQAELPQWLSTPLIAGNGRRHMLNMHQITGLLVRLNTSSSAIQALFKKYATSGTMGVPDWLEFVSNEQMDQARQERSSHFRSSSSFEAEVARAQRRFEPSGQAGGESGGDRGFNELRFALQLLDAKNNAVSHLREAGAVDDLDEPLAQYWACTSHNSYLVGDQLTGRSSADIYRRHLLQVRQPVAGHG